MTGRRGQLPSLTGIRAFAATMVLAVHLDSLWRFSHTFSHMNVVARQGAVGVSLFFALSGFVLAYSHRTGDTARAFWRRRVARVVPAYLFVIPFTIPVAIYETRHGGSLGLGQTAFNGTLLQAWVPKDTWFSGGNTVGWSLSAEAFFYLCFPAMIGPILRMSAGQRRLVFLACVAWTVAIPLVVHPSPHQVAGQLTWHYWADYIAPITRIAEFAAGVIAAAAFLRGEVPRIPLWPAVALAVVAYYVDGQVSTYISFAPITLVPFVLLIIACAQADQRGTPTIFSWKPIVALGRWSYAFYLVHDLFVRAVTEAAARGDWSADQKAVAVPAVVVLAWVTAWLLYRFVEMPLERRLRSPVAQARVEDAASAEVSSG